MRLRQPSLLVTTHEVARGVQPVKARGHPMLCATQQEACPIQGIATLHTQVAGPQPGMPISKAARALGWHFRALH